MMTIADDALQDGALLYGEDEDAALTEVRRREFQHHINMFRRRVQRRNVYPHILHRPSGRSRDSVPLSLPASPDNPRQIPDT